VASFLERITTRTRLIAESLATRVPIALLSSSAVRALTGGLSIDATPALRCILNLSRGVQR